MKPPGAAEKEEEPHMTVGKMIAMALLLLFTAAAPLGLMLFVHRRLNGRWTPFLIGAVFFPVFAMMLEPLLHLAVLGSPLGAVLQNNIWLYALYGGLAAGLFEETGRLLAFRMVLRHEAEPVTALGYGLGHGGMEAFLLVGMAMVNNLLMGVLLMQGGEVPAELSAAAETLSSTPAVMYLWSALERASAMVLHVSNSVLVFAAVRTGKRVLFPAAILLHAGMNFVAVTSAFFLPTAAAEGLVLVFALLTAALAMKVYRELATQTEGQA